MGHGLKQTLLKRWMLLGLLGGGCGAALFFTGTEGRLFFLSQLCLWLLLLLFLLRASGRIVLPCSSFSLVLALFFLLAVLTLLWTPVPAYSQSMLWRQGTVLLLFLALQLGCEERDWSTIRSLLFAVALVTALAAIIQYFLGLAPEATFLNKNSLAGFLMPLLFWALVRRPEPTAWDVGLAGSLLFCGGLVLGLIGSRGALLAVAVGGLTVFGLTRYARLEVACWYRRAGLLATGLLASLVVTGLDLGRGIGRLATLHNPWSAGNDRLLIWQSSWEMLKEAPWYGWGAGIYGLLYPQYRQGADRSAGHFAHNDLLQTAIETGWLGAALGLLLCLSALVLVGQGLHSKDQSRQQSHEIIGLFAGLVAVLFHSLFTFNLYVYVTLLVCGVVLARLYQLLPDSVGKTMRIDLNRYGRWMRYAPVAVCLIPLFWLVTGGLSQIATRNALTQVATGQSEQALRHLQTAQRLWPSNDFNWYMSGEVIRLELNNAKQLASQKRNDLFSLAEESFVRAMSLNPLRPMTPHKWGLLLLEQNLETADVGGAEQARKLIVRALEIDPRYYPARIDLARLYAAGHNHDQARAVLEAGLKHHYQNIPDLIPYLQYTAEHRRAAGDQAGAGEMEQRIQEIKERWSRAG